MTACFAILPEDELSSGEVQILEVPAHTPLQPTQVPSPHCVALAEAADSLRMQTLVCVRGMVAERCGLLKPLRRFSGWKSYGRMRGRGELAANKVPGPPWNPSQALC